MLTTVPLLLFASAARRLPYSTLGMLQFIAPTLQLLVAVFLYGEPFTRAHAIAFAAIWSALALYAAGLVAAVRRERLPADAADGKPSASPVHCVGVGNGLDALHLALRAVGVGALNWLIVPLALIGAVIGAASASRAGRNLNLIVIVIGILRLMLGHGIL